MANFRKRSGNWQARVSRKGHADLTKTFASMEDARKWARAIERELDTGTFLPSQHAKSLTLRELIDRYLAEVVPNLRGAETELIRLKTISRQLGHIRLNALNATTIAAFRDKRLKEASASTCLRELQTLSAMLGVAQREWQLIAANPVANIRKPSPNKARDRRLSAEEETRLMLALTPAQRRSDGRWSKGTRNVWLKPLVQLALETAMRRGELLSLRWENIDLLRRTAFVPLSKNGFARTIPLTSVAVKLIQSLPRSIDGSIFPLTPDAVKQAWGRARTSADLPDLHFHDLRHEAASRLADKLNVLELASVTGHRDLRMLQRYVHVKAETLALKLG